MVADLNDIDGLRALAASPLVYRYLFDRAPPDKEYIPHRVAQSVANAGETGLGMWFLTTDSWRVLTNLGIGGGELALAAALRRFMENEKAENT